MRMYTLQILYKICPLVVTIVCISVACTLAREVKGYAEVKDCHDESGHLLDSYLEIFSNISDDLTRLQCAMLCQREDRCALAVFVELLLTTRCLMFEPKLLEGSQAYTTTSLPDSQASKTTSSAGSQSSSTTSSIDNQMVTTTSSAGSQASASTLSAGSQGSASTLSAGSQSSSTTSSIDNQMVTTTSSAGSQASASTLSAGSQGSASTLSAGSQSSSTTSSAGSQSSSTTSSIDNQMLITTSSAGSQAQSTTSKAIQGYEMPVYHWIVSILRIVYNNSDLVVDEEFESAKTQNPATELITECRIILFS